MSEAKQMTKSHFLTKNNFLPLIEFCSKSLQAQFKENFTARHFILTSYASFVQRE
jgi:hypothetical protein